MTVLERVRVWLLARRLEHEHRRRLAADRRHRRQWIDGRPKGSSS